MITYGVKVDKVVDPSHRLDQNSLSDIKYVNELVRKYLGKKDFLTKYLGKGNFGSAFLTKKKTVYKFTKSVDEAASSLILSMFNKLETQVKIYKIYEIVIGKDRLFIIEKEYAKPVKKYLEDTLDIPSFDIYKPAYIIEKLLDEEHDTFEMFERYAMAYAKKEGSQTTGEIMQLFKENRKFMQSIYDFHRNLDKNQQEVGIPLSDYHLGNVGVKNEKVICFDCVTSSKYVLKQGGKMKKQDDGKIDINEKKIFSLDKEYNGIIYLYQNDNPEIQYWFFIKKNFSDKEEEADFYYSVWQIRDISFLLASILEKEYIGNMGQTSTWFNDSIRNRFLKIRGHLFNYNNVNYPVSTYGLVADSALSINIDDVIDIMTKESNKSEFKKSKFNIVGLKKIKMYKRIGASHIIRSMEEYKKDPMIFVEEKEVLFKQGGTTKNRNMSKINTGSVKNQVRNSIKNELDKMPDGFSQKALEGKLGWKKIVDGQWEKHIDGKDQKKYDVYIDKNGEDFDIRIFDAEDTSPEAGIIDGGSFDSFQSAEEWFSKKYLPKKNNGGKLKTIGSFEWTDKTIEDANDFFSLLKSEPMGSDYVGYIYDVSKQSGDPVSYKIAERYYKNWLMEKEKTMKLGGRFYEMGGNVDDVNLKIEKDGNKIKYSGSYNGTTFEGEGEFKKSGDIYSKIESEFEAKGKLTKEGMQKIRTKLLEALKQYGIEFKEGGEIEQAEQVDTDTTDELVNSYRTLLMEASASTDADELSNYEERMKEIRNSYHEMTGKEIDKIFEQEEFKMGGKTKRIIPGGLSEGKSLQDIAKRHNVYLDEIKSELIKGQKIEMEHTSSKEIAKEIAMDHLWENAKYYTMLSEMEAKMEKMQDGGRFSDESIKEMDTAELEKITRNVQHYGRNITQKAKDELERRMASATIAPGDVFDDIPEIDLGVTTSKTWIELWENFAKKHKLKVKLPHEDPQDRDEESDNAYVMLRNIIKVVRGKWIPDWEDESQAKYFPWFWMNKKRGGAGGFSLGNADFSDSSSDVGSRLCFPTQKMAEETAKEFLPIYKVFMTEK